MLGRGSKLTRYGMILLVSGVVFITALAASLATPLWANSLEPFFAKQVKIASAKQLAAASDRSAGSDDRMSQPAENARDSADEKATASRAWLGVELSDAETGAKVVRVLNDSPADKAGVKVDDIIDTIGNQTVADAKAVADAMQRSKPGDKVTLGITRGGGKMQIEVTTGTPLAPQIGRAESSRRALVPELQGLEGIALGDMFSHFMSGTFVMKDKDGNNHTILLVPGTVVTATASSLTINSNDGSGNHQFDITDTTKLIGPLFRTKIEDLKGGVSVLVITVDNSAHASYVAAVSASYNPLDEIVPQLREPRLWPMPGTNPFRLAPPKLTPTPKN